MTDLPHYTLYGIIRPHVTHSPWYWGLTHIPHSLCISRTGANVLELHKECHIYTLFNISKYLVSTGAVRCGTLHTHNSASGPL